MKPLISLQTTSIQKITRLKTSIFNEKRSIHKTAAFGQPRNVFIKSKLYQQHDGVSMGSPLTPTLANFFLAHIENKLSGKQLDFHPKLYSRYVDDIFAVFDKSDHCTKFLDLLNSQHNNIKFTVEFPSETIPFLDIEIRLNETGIDTWVYRKPTNTNLILTHCVPLNGSLD